MSNQHWNLPSSSSQHPHHHEYSPMEIDGEEEEDSHNREDERVGSGQCIICTEQWGSEGDHHQLWACPSVWSVLHTVGRRSLPLFTNYDGSPGPLSCSLVGVPKLLVHKGGGSRLNISAIGRNFARIRTLEQCPVCKAPCTLNGLTRIYGYGLPDKDLQQRYQNLEVEHENLKREVTSWKLKAVGDGGEMWSEILWKSDQGSADCQPSTHEYCISLRIIMPNYGNLPSSSQQTHHEYSPMEIDGEEEEEEERHETEDDRVESGQCIICMEQWGSEGDFHQLCCLPCGHLYGYSCISRWIQGYGTSAWCPICKAPARGDVRKLYGYALPNQDLQQRNQNLEAENEILKWEKDNLLEENRRLKLVLGTM
ncbi:hypothetical protein ACOSQ3_033433 [Xanthoceras sorbifolium]